MPQKRSSKKGTGPSSSKTRPTKRTHKSFSAGHGVSGGSPFKRIRTSKNKRSPFTGHDRSSSSSRSRTTRGTSSSRSQETIPRGFDPEILLTRRNLLIGAGVVGGIAAVGGISSAASNILSPNENIETISVPKDAVSELADFNEIPFGDYVKAQVEHHLPFGSLVWADNETVAACLCPTENTHPLNTIRLFYYSSANLVEVVKQPQGFDEGFEIYDVRCSADGVIWTECNIFEDTWRIYTGQLENATVNNIQKVDEGDSNWETPSIAASGNAAFWQVIPDTNGDLAKEKAVLRAARFGSNSYDEVYESLHSFACRIAPCADGVLIAPRINSSTRYYQLTKILASDFSVADQLTLPHGMTPCNIGYGKSGFSFAFDNIYNYGDGIANLGTYTPMKAVSPYHYDDIPWFRFGRTPSANPTWCDEWFVVKSSRAICGVHFANKSFFMIDIPNDTDTYGEYLVSSGSCNNIIGLSQITNPNENESDYALLRVFVPASKSLGNAFAE